LGRAVAATAITSIVGCSTAASVFLDLPEKREQPAAPTLAAAGTAVPLQDTVRPPIESTLNADSALALLPTDAAGDVDWVAALRSGVVRPRSGRPGLEPPNGQSDFAYDFRIKGPNEMFDALFPHSSHVAWMTCEACHPSIFPYRGTPIAMKEINSGESCGRCHGTVAFPPSTCSRCHPAMPAPSPRQTQLRHDILPARADSDSPSSSGDYPRARFAHWVHRIRYQCSACHPRPFAMRAGSDTLTMSTMQKGEACGACHDGEAAFSLLNCTTCHATPSEEGETGP
jgi:c(7)-type cytochrome triheme protein